MFNNRYGRTFLEPQAVYTETPVVLGTDGVRKMSKSVGNTIDILWIKELIRRQVMSMVTDTKRILRTDPAAGGVQRLPAPAALRRGLRGAGRAMDSPTGCVDMKRVPADRIVARYAGARERYRELMDAPGRVDEILAAGADRIKPRAECDDGRGPGEDGPPLMPC